jgi:membrane dipeptidase
MISRRRFVRDALAMGTLGVAAAVRSQGVSATALDVEHSTLVVNGLDPSRRSAEYLAMLKAGGVNCWHQSVGDDFASFASLLEFCDEHNGQIAPAGSVGGIRHLYQQGVIAHLSGWQSAEGLIVGGEPVLTNLRAYRELGLRFCGIAYNVANEFGGGCFDPR